MKYLKRAWLDTNLLLGGAATYIAIIVLPMMGLALHYYLAGFGPMSGEANIWIIYMLAPLGAAFLALFLWNLVCAPYRTERDANRKLKTELNRFNGLNSGQSVAEFWNSSEYFTVKEVSCLLAGVPISNGEIVASRADTYTTYARRYLRTN